MSNENENNDKIKAKGFHVNLSEPLSEEDKKRIYTMIAKSMLNFQNLNTLLKECIPESIPNYRVKRALAMAANTSEFLIDLMEKNGVCINLDSATMQGIITPHLIVAPAIAFDSLKEIKDYFEND